MNTLVTKTRINDNLYAITWTNKFGEFCGEYFSSETLANSKMIDLL